MMCTTVTATFQRGSEPRKKGPELSSIEKGTPFSRSLTFREGGVMGGHATHWAGNAASPRLLNDECAHLLGHR
jgi:hypothetical protein